MLIITRLKEKILCLDDDELEDIKIFVEEIQRKNRLEYLRRQEMLTKNTEV